MLFPTFTDEFDKATSMQTEAKAACQLAMSIGRVMPSMLQLGGGARGGGGAAAGDDNNDVGGGGDPTNCGGGGVPPASAAHVGFRARPIRRRR